MRYIGLTGNIASGKSAVASMMAARGATLIDADVLAREAVAPGTRALAAITARWGSDLLAADGTLDRAKLRHIVFGDRALLDELNAIVHPEIAALRDQRMAEAEARGDAVVVYVVPLLFERNLTNEFDRIVLVDAPRATRLDRLMRTRGLGQDEAMRMIGSQMPAELKRARADVVIENTGTIRDLERRVDDVWEQLTAPPASSSLAR